MERRINQEQSNIKIMSKYRRYFVRDNDNLIVWARRGTLGMDFFKYFHSGPFKSKTKAVRFIESKQTIKENKG